MALELVERQSPSTARRYVEDAKADVEAMGHLTDDLLQYARASLALPATDTQTVSLAPIVASAVAREAGGRPNVHVAVPPGLAVHAQAALLERAVANVVRNAVRYAGMARIDIAAATDNGHVELTIADEGPGVPEEALRRLFEPFYRVDAARTRDAGGVGLGLAIVRSTVEASGGTVTAENKKPHGLSVRLTLPAA